MAHLIDNEFASYALTEEEALQGSILTITQKQVIQNQLSSIAEQKINLIFDTDKPDSFIQEEAYLKGQLEMLRHLLDVSTASEEIFNNPENNT